MAEPREFTLTYLHTSSSTNRDQNQKKFKSS
jgi:hypothetical protein